MDYNFWGLSCGVWKGKTCGIQVLEYCFWEIWVLGGLSFEDLSRESRGAWVLLGLGVKRSGAWILEMVWVLDYLESGFWGPGV